VSFTAVNDRGANGTSAAEQPTELLHPMQEAPRAVLLLSAVGSPRLPSPGPRVQEGSLRAVSVCTAKEGFGPAGPSPPGSTRRTVPKQCLEPLRAQALLGHGFQGLGPGSLGTVAQSLLGSGATVPTYIQLSSTTYSYLP